MPGDDTSGVVMEYTEDSGKTTRVDPDDTRKVLGATCREKACGRPAGVEMPHFQPLPEDRCINAGGHGWCAVERVVWARVLRRQ